jgi:DNA-binding NarL/FixJ family response regulator
VTTGHAPAPRIAILAVRRAGATVVPIRTGAGLAGALDGAAGCIVDLTARAYDGVQALQEASAAGVPAIALSQHDDAELRRAAKAAGASHVFAYRALHEHGDRDLGAWIAGLRPITQETP